MKFKVQVIRTHLFCMYNTIMQLRFNVLELVFWNTRHAVIVGAGQSTGSWLLSATTYSFQIVVWDVVVFVFLLFIFYLGLVFPKWKQLILSPLMIKVDFKMSMYKNACSLYK